MTPEEILEYNKRCAEFLEFNFENDIVAIPKNFLHITNALCYDVNNLKFHSDWNWIMEVVEKIQTLDRLGGIVMIQQGRCKITSRMAGDRSVYADVSYYFEQGMKGQKQAVVQAINEFLTWYKENTQCPLQ